MEHYHFIGINGVGMSGLASILLDQKCVVSGSDLAITERSQQLVQKGAHISEGHSAEHIPSGGIVVYSSAIVPDNEEYKMALIKADEVIHRAELLARLMEKRKGLGVTGTHGKTTTTSLLTYVLQQANEDPGFSIGGFFNESNGGVGKGEYFVGEVDESDGSLKHYQLFAGIITNIDADHMTHYKTMENLRSIMDAFALQVKNPSLLFYNGDCPELAQCSFPDESLSFGFGCHCDIQISHYHLCGNQSVFDLEIQGKCYKDIKLNLLGRYNVLNAASVFSLALMLGISEEAIRKGLTEFPGVQRRFEKKKQVREILFYDDYAHHPTAIVETLKMVYDFMPHRRIVAVFQPHRFSRFQYSWNEFLKAFSHADIILVTDVAAAGEKPIEGITAEEFVKSIKISSAQKCSYVPREQLKDALTQLLLPYDVCITLGAGDITKLHTELKDFQGRSLKVGFLFGGPSCEHDISILSARNIIKYFDEELHHVVPCCITRQNHWILGDKAQTVLTDKTIVSAPSDQGTEISDPAVQSFFKEIDVIFPMLHGPFGEDGKIQALGFFYGKPVIGPSFQFACLSMDKSVSKRLAIQAGIPTVPFLDLHLGQWKHNSEQEVQRILDQFTFPFFVKSCHLGSSISVFCVSNRNELLHAIHDCFMQDDRLLVEQSFLDAQEVEFSFLGDAFSPGLVTGVPVQMIKQEKFVDYNLKYGLNGSAGVGSKCMPLDDPVIQKGIQWALKAYQVFGGTGLARVDFFLDKNNEFWFSEANSIPGFTQASLYPKSLEAQGISPQVLMEHLLAEALKRYV